jgi:Ser/Thr protein kinase RdoA (MazF antagonist)
VRHGGLAAALWRGRVLGVGRPAAELRGAAALAAAGAPVARAAFVAGERRLGLWRAAVATWLEPNARDAAAFLAAGPDRSRALRAAAAAGLALRRFHDAGGRHADLHAGNLLVREGDADCEVRIVDLDRARRGKPPSAPARMAEMMRLYRSLVKRGLACRLGARGCAAFLRAYTGRDRRLRRALLRRLPRELRLLRRHRLGYSLAGSLASGQPR